MNIEETLRARGYSPGDRLWTAMVNHLAGTPSCTCDVIDITEMGSHARKSLAVPDGGCPVHGEKGDWTDVSQIIASGGDGETDTSAVESGTVDDVSEPDWGCCDRPKPRIHEQSNRFFCGNCLLWLDQREGTPAVDADEGTVGQSPEGKESE